MGKLYVVATPIGNLEDITLRALSVLKEADVILCEDTRTTKKLLTHYQISKPTLSYHSHSTLSREKEILKRLKEGQTLALVSDAGTPGISDPGSLLIRHIQEEDKETEIIPIPGPSALIAALSVSGLDTSSFMYLGFIPHKKGRETLFKKIAETSQTIVFYESTHRILKTLASLSLYLKPKRQVLIGRELTKKFEELVRGTSQEVENYFIAHPEKVRGEFVVVVDR